MSEEKKVVNAVVKQERFDMRTPIEALKEIRDRLTYFCLRTDGKYDPPWATELVGIIDDAVTACHAVGNAAAMREALESVREWCINKLGDSSFHVTVEGLLCVVNNALSAPARNCDRYTDEVDALSAFINEALLVPAKSEFVRWLFAPVTERKGEN